MKAAVLKHVRHRDRRNPAEPDSASVTSPEPHAALHISMRALSDLTVNPRNARKHSEKQIAQIAASIRQFRFINPIVVDQSNTILAGHARFAAAKLVGLREVPVILVEHLSPAERRAYMLADNKLAQLAEWDNGLLKVELAELSATDLDFSVELTGFSTAEIDLILDDPGSEGDDTEEVLPPLKEHAVSRPGELWQLGRHRLLCADAREPASYSRLLGADKASLIITDSPYNVKISGHASGLGRRQHPEFAMASGEMSDDSFRHFLTTVFSQLAAHSTDGSLHYLFIDHKHVEEMLSAGRAVYDERKNILVWVKTNAGMGTHYRSQHELICVYKHGKRPHVNNIQLGATGRYRTNVLQYAGANTFRSGRDDELARHPTPKPVPMIADFIRDASKVGDLVLDSFVGGGTIFIAAEKTRRRAAGIEISPIYCDLSIERWQTLTGEAAILAETGQSYAELAAGRVPEPVSSVGAGGGHE